jgi:hypothetical protein
MTAALCMQALIFSFLSVCERCEHVHVLKRILRVWRAGRRPAPPHPTPPHAALQCAAQCDSTLPAAAPGRGGGTLGARERAQTETLHGPRPDGKRAGPGTPARLANWSAARPRLSPAAATVQQRRKSATRPMGHSIANSLRSTWSGARAGPAPGPGTGGAAGALRHARL